MNYNGLKFEGEPLPLSYAEIEDIRRGLLDAHFGRVFSGRVIHGAFEGNLLERLWYDSFIELKRLWWKIKSPFQKFTHRNCKYCAKLEV